MMVMMLHLSCVLRYVSEDNECCENTGVWWDGDGVLP